MITLLFLAFVFTTTAQNCIGDKADIQQILANTAQFSKYVIASDYDNIANAYTTDGKIFPNNREIIWQKVNGEWKMYLDIWHRIQ